MSANPHIDELLCGFIDGELPLRQQTEVQRMATRDPEVAQRLQELRSCKNLVGALPRAEAPGEMLEQIKLSLERRTLLEDRPVSTRSRAGARHLMARRFMTAAAMIALLAGLGAVVYQIVAPVQSVGPSGPMARGDDPLTIETTLPVAAPVVVADSGFSGRLELRTAALAQADAFLKRTIDGHGLSALVESESVDNRRIYRLSCSRADIGRVLRDLSSVAQNFGGAVLTVETDRFADPVVVEPVTLRQVAKVIDRSNAQAGIRLARDLAALNAFARDMPGSDVLPSLNDSPLNTVVMPTIPRPVLTGPDKANTVTSPTPEGEVKARLTIILLNTE